VFPHEVSWEKKIMRSKLALCVLLALTSAAYAKDKQVQSGKLLQMDSVPCGTSEKDAKVKKTQQVLCQEYVVQAERVNYRIRPRDEKHPTLLPVGSQAEFRMEKDKMLLRVDDLDNKEREYVVVSMTPRPDQSTSDSASAIPNHRQ
jgi:hypothetical protein